MPDQVPRLQVLAGMYRDAGEGIEARRRTEEGIVPLGNEDAAGIRVEARQYGVANGAVAAMFGSCRDTARQR